MKSCEELRNIDSINTFKLSILNFARPRENSVFDVYDINDVKLLTQLRLDFSQLNEHKFRNNLNDIINPMRSCGKTPEITFHYLLRCDLYPIYRQKLLKDICAFSESLKNFSEENFLKILFYRAEDLTSQMNSEILKCTLKFFKKADRFSGPLFLFNFFFYFFCL